MKTGFVSFIGRPNAGKSTLLNRLVGTKLAIVSDKPQTTRTRIPGVRNYPDAQVVFLDTPGIHRPLHRMNVRMVDAAVETLREVDVDEIARRLDVHIEREGFETVGGYLLSHLGRVPAVGERFDVDGLTVEVLDAERRRVTKVRIWKKVTAEPGPTVEAD